MVWVRQIESVNLPILYCDLLLIEGIGNNTVEESPVEQWGTKVSAWIPLQFYTNG